MAAALMARGPVLQDVQQKRCQLLTWQGTTVDLASIT
jgi:hypothetical protein